MLRYHKIDCFALQEEKTGFRKISLCVTQPDLSGVLLKMLGLYLDALIISHKLQYVKNTKLINMQHKKLHDR